MTPDDADLQAALATFNEQSLARIRYLRKQAALIGVEEHDMAAALSMRPPSPPPPATLSGIPGTARHVKRLTAAEPPRGRAAGGFSFFRVLALGSGFARFPDGACAQPAVRAGL